MEKTQPLSITQVGPYPPPYGGVSVHIKRLHEKLLKEGIESHLICNRNWCQNNHVPLIFRRVVPLKYFSYFNRLLGPGRLINTELVHYHDNWGIDAPVILGLLLRRKKMIITVHNQKQADEWPSLNVFQKFASKILIRSRNVFWIVVSEHIKGQLLDFGIPAAKITQIPAFISPESSDLLESAIPPHIERFAAEHSPLLSVYGWRLTIDEIGTDIYGFDLSIELINELKSEYPGIGLIICLPQVRLSDYLAELKNRIDANGLQNMVIFQTDPMDEAWLLWRMSDLFIRPTSTDGDSVSVREALSFGIPVVASNASPRPEGVVLFEKGNLSAFVTAVRQALSQNRQHTNSVPRIEGNDSFPIILNLYKNVALQQ